MIADFLNEQLRMLGKNNKPAGAVIAIDTGEQCTISGVGPMYDEFLWTDKFMDYSGFGEEATPFYDKDFEEAPLRIIKYDETFYRMPYDVCTSKTFKLKIKS